MQTQEDDGRRVRLDNDLYRPQTTLDGLGRLYGDDSGQAESARRRSSSDPSGRSRRPRLAVLRPHGNNNAVLAPVLEDANNRIGSTACFNAPDGRNAVRPELADVLDVIGALVSFLLFCSLYHLRLDSKSTQIKFLVLGLGLGLGLGLDLFSSSSSSS